MRIAFITQPAHNNYVTDTLLDGISLLHKENTNFEFRISHGDLGAYRDVLSSYQLDRVAFINYAREADIIVWCHGIKQSEIELAHAIGEWRKTVVVDGSELGKNNRYDFSTQKKVLTNFGAHIKIPDNIRFQCPLYFRREKPYLDGMIPLPFGIESRFLRYVASSQKKDIDFVCIYGQDEYPILRRHTREYLEKFCRENSFTCATEKTKGSDEFYKLLSRAKVGISVGGGGYDTLRFWEILGNNCLLLTERIDIYHPDSKELDFGRIYQFNNLFDFAYQLKKVGEFLRNGYRQEDLEEEYKKIVKKHSSKARILQILEEAQKRI